MADTKTTTSSSEKTQSKSQVQRLYPLTGEIIKRSEEAEEKRMDEFFANLKAEREAKANEEALKILETEWKDERSAWEAMLEMGYTPTDALETLKSFA